MARRLTVREEGQAAALRWWHWLPRRRYAVVGSVDAADLVPDRLPRKAMVVVAGSSGPSWVAFDCPSPRRHRLLIPHAQTSHPRWQLTASRRPSLRPSVDITEDRRQCHFWVVDGCVRWVGRPAREGDSVMADADEGDPRHEGNPRAEGDPGAPELPAGQETLDPLEIPKQTPLLRAFNVDRYRRQETIKAIQGATARRLICYVAEPSAAITRDDVMPLMDLLHQVEIGTKVDLLLHPARDPRRSHRDERFVRAGSDRPADRLP